LKIWIPREQECNAAQFLKAQGRSIALKKCKELEIRKKKKGERGSWYIIQSVPTEKAENTKEDHEGKPQSP